MSWKESYMRWYPTVIV